MFTGGIGQIDARHTAKSRPSPACWSCKVGGPAYRIGMGGGAASSMVQGENAAELDFNAVQRGDAEMEQKLNRVIRACNELGDGNPIVSIHDQGAGGNCNVLKEIVDPAGARIEIREIPVGDQTLSVLEIWGAEYQENNALLLRAGACRELPRPVRAREGPGRRRRRDHRRRARRRRRRARRLDAGRPRPGRCARRHAAEDLRVIPRSSRPSRRSTCLTALTVRDALDRVLRLLSVGSKRFLTNKVDRAVTGLIARQQCAGPLQLTVADVAVIAQTHLDTTGGATAIGEQPIKGLLDPAAMARLTVGEALTNLVWAQVSALPDVRCSGNWMWAAKLPGEGAALYDAAPRCAT